jgi:hypothetical protein
MAAIAPQSLLSESNCFRCFGGNSDVQLFRLSLLARILTILVPMAATDPQTLLAYAKCYQCNGEASLADMMELALLDQISQNIGGGAPGGGGTHAGLGSPEGVVVGALGEVYTDYSDPVDPGVWVKTADAGLATGWANVIAVGP